MDSSHETQIEMDLTAAERELARTLASLSPTITAGVASVPTRELMLRAGAVRSKQRLRYWQAGSVLVLAGFAAAYVIQPTQSQVQPVPGSLASTQIEVPIPDNDPDLKASLTDAFERLQGYTQVSAVDPSGAIKMVLRSTGTSGEILIQMVPQDWELCDH